MSDDSDFYADADYIDDDRAYGTGDGADHVPDSMYPGGLLPGEKAGPDGRPILPSMDLIAGIHKKRRPKMDEPHSFFTPTAEFDRTGCRLATRIAPVHTSAIAVRDYVRRADKYTAVRLSAANKKETHHD